MKAKKVALVYDAIFPYVMGGGEKRFYELGKHMTQLGYEVHLYGMKFWDGPTVIEKDGMYLHGLCRAYPLYTSDGRRSIKQAVLFGLSCFKLVREDFDLIDCCGFPYFSMFPSKAAAVIRRKPLYATWHEVWGKKYWRDYLGKLGFVGFAVEKIASRLPDQIIAVSDYTARRLRYELKVKAPVSVVPNGLDIDALEAIAPAAEQSDIMYAGRLVDFKNVHLIIDALDILNQKGKRLSCLIVGDGPERQVLEKRAKQKNVDQQIIWRGFIQEMNGVYEHMKSSKVFVLPSEREGFGMVVVEANACGTPVVTTSQPNNAAKDLIEDGRNGYVANATATDISVRIMQLLDDQQEAPGTVQAQSRYYWKNLAKEVARVFDYS